MNFRSIEKKEVFVVTVCEGDGSKDNPCREVKYYMVGDSHGEYKELCRDDPFKGGEE